MQPHYLEVFMTHAGSPLTETGRLRLARCVVDEGWPPARAATRFGVSATTATCRADRYWVHGPWGSFLAPEVMSAPHAGARRTTRRGAARHATLGTGRNRLMARDAALDRAEDPHSLPGPR
jgi:hypothetical protein